MSVRSLRLAGLATTLLTALSACSQGELVWYGHTADRAQRVELRSRGRTEWVTIGEHRTADYSAVAAESITFGPHGRWAFAAARGVARQRHWYVVSNDGQSAAWDGVADVQFTASGKLVYLTKSVGRWRVVVNGVAGPLSDAIAEDSIDWSPDGARVGYVAVDGHCQAAVIDGVRGPCMREIVDFAVGDSPAFDVYLARTKPGQGAVLYVGRRRLEELTSPRGLYRDRSGRHWAVVAASGAIRGWQLVVEHGRGPVFDDIGSVVWAPDASEIAYTARAGSEWFVIRHGEKKSKPYRRIQGPIFSEDGRRLAWIGRTRTESEVVVDGRTKWRGPAEATALQFDPRGKRVVWVYGGKSESVVAVDRMRFRYDVVVEDSVCFSENGDHWAALVGSRAQRKLFIVVDGHRTIPFDTAEFFGGAIRDRDTTLEMREWVEAELSRFLAGQSPT